MSANAAPARLAGSVLGGRYRVGRLLGEGGMGAVYEASPVERPHERYAVKVLHEEMAANPTVVERFLAEGDVCRRMQHPGVLRIFDFGQDRGVPFLVMELLEGRALIEYTEHQQRLPVNFAVTVCAGVLHALDYAHSQGIIHRDLKPENVFLVPGPGGAWQTKLLDFGIARAIDAAGGGRRRTATGVLLGTPGYMSPEQVKAARNVDHRTDLWAVGVMFYEMITGSPAFPSDGDDPNNIWGLISAVLTKEPVPLSVYDPHLQPFEAFIKRALSKDLDHRYGSAREMSEDLLRIARGDIRTSDPQSPNASPFTREQKLVPINSRGELAAIPGVGDLGATQWAPPPQQGQPVLGTMPSGVQRPASSSPIPMGTVPQGPERVTVDSYRNHSPMMLAGTVPAGPAPTPRQDLAATALASPDQLPSSVHQPKYGTSPSGYKPPQPHVPSAPSPLIQPPRGADEPDSGGSAAPWIILGVVLIAALAGAVAWALH
jgi:eukaryotic-like serine/threonine-protein kinase